MPFHLGGMELVFVLIIVLVVFGAGRLPEVGNAVGRSIRELRDGLRDEQSDAQTDMRPSPESHVSSVPSSTQDGTFQPRQGEMGSNNREANRERVRPGSTSWR
jgi:sec-independent protein translocase protein TatA